MSEPLRQRARIFLLRPIPEQLNYVSGSVSEQAIAAYAARGPDGLDAEMRELLELCAMEAQGAAAGAVSEVRAYLEESAAILGEILAGR
jgi:hypothetical protein